MFQSILIMVVVFGGCFMYYKFAMQKTRNLTANFDKNAVAENIENHVNELTSSKLDYLKKWMNGAPIDLFTDASIPVSVKDKAKNAAVDAAKSVAWAAVGVKAKYKRVEAVSHLVLSNDNLHFLAADIDGNLQTHLTFTPDQLNNAKIEYKGPKKGADLASGLTDFLSEKLNKEENMVNVFAITLKHDKEDFTIQAHDKIVLPFEMGDSGYAEKAMVANVIAENFFEKLGERYPNLIASKGRLVS